MMDIEIEHPDWLPVGWKVTVKARSSGKKDKYYIDPSTGHKFSSRPRVLHYLKSSKKIQKPNCPVKVEIGKPVTGELPPGWIKKIRTTRKHGRTRRDATYIDPVSGRHFRSKQEVFRYIESKPIRRGNVKTEATKSRCCCLLPSRVKAKVPRRSISRKAVCICGNSGPRNANELKDDTMGIANMSKGSGSVENEEEVCLAVEFSDNLQKVKERANKLQREIEKLVDTKAVKYEDKDQTPKLEKKLSVYGRELSRRLADSRHKGSKSSAKKNITKIGNLEGLSKREGLKRKRTGELPRRTSQRLARVGASSSLEGEPNNKSGPMDEPEIDTEKVKPNGLKELARKGEDNSNGLKELLRKAGTCSSSDAKTNNKTGLLDALDINIKKALIVSSGTKELPTKHGPENPATDQQKQPTDETHEKHPESNLENLLMDPCIEFAIKTLTGAIPIEDVTKVSNGPSVNHTSASFSMFPSTINVWTDPSFEFPVKTPTSEAPAQFQITIQQAGRDNGGKTQVR